MKYFLKLRNNRQQMFVLIVPEGDECRPNVCGENSGCRVVNDTPVCFCLPEYEGNPPAVPCQPPKDACSVSSCGPNTQCTRLPNGIAKCTCLPGFIESPNTIRGCVEPKSACEPFPCGFGASCDVTRSPVCYCPEGTVGNPFRQCTPPEIPKELCRPGPCGGKSYFFKCSLHFLLFNFK